MNTVQQDRGRKPSVDPRIRDLLAKIHIAKKELALDEATYRAILSRVTGCDSAKGLAVGKLISVLDEFKRLGWAPPSRGRAGDRRMGDGIQEAKIRALWLALWNLGAVEDPSEAALGAYVKRIGGVDAPRFLRPAGARRVIETLKQWGARGGIVWDASADPRLCLFEAQRARLGLNRDQVVAICHALRVPAVVPMCGPSDLDKLSNELGRRIREVPGG